MSRSAVTAQAKQLQAKLEIKPRKYKEKLYQDCFIGTACVELMIQLKFVSNTQEAINFGNQLIQYNLIQHIEKNQSFKNESIYYQFLPSNESKNKRRSLSISSNTSAGRRRKLKQKSSARLMAGARHRKQMTSLGSVSQLVNDTNYVKRRDVYFRVNKYMRQNRLTDARTFLKDLLKYAAKGNIDWGILRGPTLDNSDINHINSAVKEKFLQDIVGESRVCWIDITLLECKLKLFYEYNPGDYDLCKECITKLQSILNAIQRSNDTYPTLNVQSYYFRFIECESRASLAYSIVKSSRIGYAAYAGLALEHCRKAMKLDPFHSSSHAMYGYLLDRCLDKFEEARQYLEYAIHLNNYYDNVNIDKKNEEQKEEKSDKIETKKKGKREKKKKDRSFHRFAFIHIWLATLLVNFEEEFREIEYEMEIKLRADFKKKYEVMLKTKNRKLDLKKKPKKKLQTTDLSDNESEKSSPSPLKTPSAFLVKQLSHAHDERRAIGRHLARSSMSMSVGFGDSGTSFDFANVTSLHSNMSEFQNMSHPSMHSNVSDFDPFAPGNGLTPDMAGDTPGVAGVGFPSPQGLVEEQSVLVQTMMTERLSDETLNSNIGQRFGADFAEQMETISSKSEDHFLLALQLEPQNGRFHSVYGVFLVQSEKYEAAKPHFEKAIKYDSNNVVSLNNLGYILSLPRFSQYQQAKNYLTKAAKLRPKCANILFNLARLLAHAFGSEQIQNAKRYYLAALMNDNENAHIHYFYALFLRFMVKDNESAKKHLRKSKEYLAASMSDNQDKTDMTIEVNGYIEHAKILQHESKFKAARFLLQMAARLDVTKKREIAQLLRSIKSEEKEMDMLKRGY